MLAFLTQVKEGWRGLSISFLIGLTAYSINKFTKTAIADPLVIALVLGILVRIVLKDIEKLEISFEFSPKVFIPIGIIFYALNNLNFLKVARVDPNIFSFLGSIVFIYFAIILVLGIFLKQKDEITYLTATGSAICGASAIVITSPAIKADADDISISILAVTLVGLVGLFIVIPLSATYFGISNQTYSILSGSVLQLTGFVKAAIENIPSLKMKVPPNEMTNIAISIKAAKYMVLLISIPLFSSLIRDKFYIPWFLWAFLIAGIFGTWVYAVNEAFYEIIMIPAIKPIYKILWSVAMAAVGLNMDVKKIFSKNGMKALIMAAAGFIAATAVFYGVAIYVFFL